MFNGLMLTGGWVIDMIIDGMRALTHLIDKGIYTIVQVSYQVFASLAQATLLNDRIVTSVTNRIYTILAIVMVFVLAFNLMTYIIDPDKIQDKQVGATAFVKDVIIALAIISFTPMLFTKLYSFQSKVLESGVIANLILGGSSSELTNTPPGENPTAYAMKAGSWRMTASIYTAFVYPTDNYTVLDCGTSGLPSYMDGYCDAYSMTLTDGNIAHFGDYITNSNFEFTPFLSTIAGVVLLFFIVSFCIMLAKRVGKLAIIQFLAPIPVTLELLPNKKGLRKNWFDTLIKSYLEVFMYLTVMYAVILLISLVPDAVATLFSNGGDWGLVKVFTIVFLIYGLLQFGKEAPQLLFDLLGVKSSGAIRDALKGGRQALGRARMGASFVRNGAMSVAENATQNFNNTEGNGWKKFRSAVAGGASAAGRNVVGLKNVHNVQDISNNRRQVNATVQQRRADRTQYRTEHGGTFSGAMRGHVEEKFGEIKDWGHTFAHGGGDGNTRLEMLSRLSQYTSSAKVDKAGDAEYNEYKSRYDKLKTDAGTSFASDFEAWRRIAGNSDKSENDFVDAIIGGYTPASRSSYNDIQTARKRMTERETAIKKSDKNKQKLQEAAAATLALFETNPGLAKELSAGGTPFDINSIKSYYDAKTGTVTDAVKLQKAMDDLNKTIAARQSAIRTETMAERIKQEGRKGSDGDKKGSGH